MEKHYDVVIIGSGAGGGTLAYSLAKFGFKVLLVERGDYLVREKENWNPRSVFIDNRYHAKETWYDKESKPFAPGINDFVGGNTKLYGAALLRLRKEDFGEIQHYGGISPAWPMTYEEFQPYYLEAEKLYTVHGLRKEDPTEPPESSPYPYPPISHEPYIQDLADKLKEIKLHPFHLPLALRLNEKDREKSPCIRCDTCDGYPCLVHAKSDAHISCVIPALQTGNVTLMTHAKALRLLHDDRGKTIKKAEIERHGVREFVSGDIFVVLRCYQFRCALLRSKSPRYPNGIANTSGIVGRHYMFHQNSVMISVSTTRNPTKYEKTLAINDYYFNAPDSSLPLGHIQLLGNVKKEMLVEDAPIFVPGMALEVLAEHSIGWWLTSEDLRFPRIVLL